ncbi:MAG: cupin-like domain-containing protein [Flammeovirgaceae bacterium]
MKKDISSRVRNYDSSHPQLPKGIKTWQWSSLFLYDLFFGITARRKNENGQVMKKFSNNSSIGKQFKKIHNSNTKRLLALNGAHNYSKPLDLPVISPQDFNAEWFLQWKTQINMPLVIKNYLKDAPILQRVETEQLINDYGNKKVVCVQPNSIIDSKDESGIGQNLHDETTTLKEFLLEDKYKNYYINNFFGILNNEDFLRDCKGKELDSLLGRENILTQWFISRKTNSGSSLHCASADNMFLNIKGRKEWFFIHPSYTSIMQPSMSKHGVFCVSELEESFEGDFYEGLVERYPHMKYVPVYRVVLEEGDLLFNPPWWWHRVKNLSDQTIGCATRYYEANKSWSNGRTFTIGMIIESLKNPKKSPMYLTYKSLRNKDYAENYITSIFSKKDKTYNKT